eukprot:928673-Amorphochlora_amoeboformis.AAC.1
MLELSDTRNWNDAIHKQVNHMTLPTVETRGRHVGDGEADEEGGNAGEESGFMDSCFHSGIHGFIDSWIHGFMDSWIHGFGDSWIHEFMDLRIHNSWIHGFIDRWVHGCVNVWMYVCIDALMHV